jgi:integrase
VAGIFKDPNGCRRIHFVSRDRKRKTVRLGKISKHQAETARGHIANLVAASFTRQAPPPETSRWVADLPDLWRKRLEKVQLVAPLKPEPAPEPEPVAPKLTLNIFLADYMASRVDIKQSTRVALNQTVGYLVGFLGSEKPLEDITEGDAKEWCFYLKGTKDLSDNTIRRRSGAAKQFFQAAIGKRLLAANPFSGLKSTVRGNPAREHYIDLATAQKVLDACPDAEWRLIFALCRFGGLRCPSEVLGLTWGDIHWAEGRFTVHSPKTEHHPGHESREVPIFPELLPYLREVFEAAVPGTEHVITRYRHSNQNLQTKLRRILKKAGIAAWPKLYQNLRSTRQTELTDVWPVHKVCKWLGNSAAVAVKHYLQDPTDDDFSRAAQKATQTPPATSCHTLTSDGKAEGETASDAVGQGVASGGSTYQEEWWAIQDLNL